MKKQIDRKSNGDKSEFSTRATSMTSDSALELIRARAYRLFELRGNQPGHELDDWLQAEREILRPSPSPEGGITSSLLTMKGNNTYERRELNTSNS